MGLDDYGFFENWLVCDFHLRREVPGLPTFRQVCNPAEPIAIVNIGPRYHRFSFRLEAQTSREEATHAERVWERVREYLHPDYADLVRTANYTFRSAIAEQWRTGRVLLAGDAAHQMPPFLAQGMVSGIRDARNLAWKLGMVLAGHSDELLNSYQEEREPHVRFITEKAIELGRVQTMRDVEEAERRDARMIAARRANESPVKLVYPAFSGGLVSSGGDLFPQGLVSSSERTALLDDVVGTGWLMVANGAPVLDALSQPTVTPSRHSAVVRSPSASPACSSRRPVRHGRGVRALVRQHPAARPSSCVRTATYTASPATPTSSQHSPRSCSASSQSPSETPNEPRRPMEGKIALEEHWAIPETLQDSAGFVPGTYWDELQSRLLDVQDRRLRLMDENGIETMILSLNAPAVQAIPDRRQAIETARRANDALAKECALQPDRFRAFAALPLQDPDAAARSCGTTSISSASWARWSTASPRRGTRRRPGPAVLRPAAVPTVLGGGRSLDVPFYLHPRNPLPQDARIYEGHPWLLGPTWAFAQETAVHALRLMALRTLR